MKTINKRKKATEKETEEFIESIRRRYSEFVIQTLSNGIESSIHLLKGGRLELFFVDFDYITEDPQVCEIITKEISKKIGQIASYRERKPDFLGFIEKDGIGTAGAIKLSSFISSMTGIPNILIRHNRELPYARLKISKRYWTTSERRLEGNIVLMISDVSTTAKELIDAINDVRINGGDVRDAILYFSKCSTETIKALEDMGVSLHALITEPQAREVALNPEYKDNAIKLRVTFEKIAQLMKK
jgi:orotate phosphoribosyltransferase